MFQRSIKSEQNHCENCASATRQFKKLKTWCEVDIAMVKMLKTLCKVDDPEVPID